MKLVLDMNLPPGLCDPLRSAGFDADHWSSIGSPTASDAEIMRYGRTDSAVILSHDLDFSAILAASGADGPSVIQIRSDDLSADLLVDNLVRVLQQMRTELQQGAIISLDVQSARVRMLPLRRRS